MEPDNQIGSIKDHANPDGQQVSREIPRTRKVTVQLSENTFERLEAATDRPGFGKSMVVETALERFFDPAAPIEGLIHEQFDWINTNWNAFKPRSELSQRRPRSTLDIT